MDFDYQLESKEQFWDEVTELLSSQIHSTSLVESAVRSFLRFIESYIEYLDTDEDLMRCCYEFMACPWFVKHRGHVRRRLITTLVRPACSVPKLIVIGLILLLDGKDHVDTFEMMEEEAACRLMVDVLWHRRGEDARLHHIFAELLYEMCRVQRLRYDDLAAVSEDFVEFLFQAVERGDDYDSDPYSSSQIRILLVLNEQYMLLQSHLAATGKPLAPLENKVMRVLATQGATYKTFGTNVIILLNREREPCLQLLILKLLYQLFSTPSTYEYFYTNDLRVLTDVFIRELNDLPDEAETLRHAFLRVLYPLLAHSQLRLTHYKELEIVRLLQALSGTSRSTCFLPISATVARLAARCSSVSWIRPLFEREAGLLLRADSAGSESVGPDLAAEFASPAPSPAPSPTRARQFEPVEVAPAEVEPIGVDDQHLIAGEA